MGGRQQRWSVPYTWESGEDLKVENSEPKNEIDYNRLCLNYLLNPLYNSIICTVLIYFWSFLFFASIEYTFIPMLYLDIYAATTGFFSQASGGYSERPLKVSQ